MHVKSDEFSFSRNVLRELEFNEAYGGEEHRFDARSAWVGACR